VYGAPSVPPATEAPRARRWRTLKVAAGCTFLAVPADLALLDWVSRSTTGKAECYTPLPGYQAALATVVPAAFVVLGLVCSVAGIVALVHGRRRGVRAQRDSGVVTLALAVPALLFSLGFGAATWFAVGFSTWCF
jgi:hypothetical protein